MARRSLALAGVLALAPFGVGAEPPAREALGRGFAPTPDDGRRLDEGIRPGPGFREVPGSTRFSGQLIVRVRTPADLIARGEGPERVASRRARALARLAPSVVESFPEIDEHTIALPAGWDESRLASFLMSSGDYEYALPNWWCSPTRTPDDPRFVDQTHHVIIGSEAAWETTTGDPTIITAFCDTGVDLAHPDLAPSLVPGFNAVSNVTQAAGGDVADESGHGTAVAGAGSAIGNNATGVCGVGWGFRIMPVKVSERADGDAMLADILQGARWAVDNGARSISASYGGITNANVNTTGAYIQERGGVLAYSSGNDGTDLGDFERPFVVVVGASDNADELASFSNTGTAIDVVAPGVDVLSTVPGGGYAPVTGTSFAAPMVNAAMAMIISANPDLTPDQVRRVLYDSATDLGPVGEDRFTGRGRIDLADAMARAISGVFKQDLPFADPFEGPLVNEVLWLTNTGASVSADATSEPSPPFSLELMGNEMIESAELKASTLRDETVAVTLATQDIGVEQGERLLVEYLAFTGVWSLLGEVVSDGVADKSFVDRRWALPQDAFHDDLQIRLRAGGDEPDDRWFVDDVGVAPFDGITPPLEDGFEDGLDRRFVWSLVSGGAVTTGAARTGEASLRLDPTGSVETFDVKLAGLFFDPHYVRFFSAGEGLTSADRLLVEYRNINGLWIELDTIPADTGPAPKFRLRQCAVPLLGFHDGFRIRMTALGATPGAGWFIDDFAIGTDLFIDDPCPPDLAGPAGVLDIFDILAFLTLFDEGGTGADLAEPFGQLDIFDILAFLDAFDAGCP